MKKKTRSNNSRHYRNILLTCFFIIGLGFFVIGFINISNVQAQEMPDIGSLGGSFGFSQASKFKGPTISVGEMTSVPTKEQTFGDKVKAAWDKAWEAAKKAYQKTGSKAYGTAINKALSKMAYDAANYIASGGKGQSPMAITENMGEYFTNIADEAAGDFIQELGKEWNVNFCKPDFALKVNISMGLAEQYRPKKPDCKFSELKKNWDKELDNPDFFPIATEMFEPTGNPWGTALGLQTMMAEEVQKDIDAKQMSRLISGLWKDERGIDERLKGLPGQAKKEWDQTSLAQASNVAQYTGDALIDATNIFLNQLAISMFNELMRSALKDSPPTTQPYDWDKLRYEADPGSGSGIAAAKDKFREIIKPKFTTRGDYNVLAELNMCPNPEKAGPTNCVIDDRMTTAVQEKLTVGQALRQGYLNGAGTFGFLSNGREPEYNEGYPYRSMIIMRKFRIIPVGWELAAQYIAKQGGTGVQSLQDMVDCFDKDDEFGDWSADWCQGLVDPDWVLKAPKNYCRREGPGPEIVSNTVVGEGRDARMIVSRNEDYCADEQACINENEDGTCNFYGYCTEEKRGWKFGAEKCDPVYNTCETFRSREGKTVSFLENNIDYDICAIDNVGCERYSNSFPAGTYNADRDLVPWTEDSALFFDQEVSQCEEDREGCHEYIRTKPGIGANMLVNSSFENITSGDIDDSVNDVFDNWSNLAGEAVSDSFSGLVSVQLDGLFAHDLGIVVHDDPNFNLNSQTFTLSFYSKDCDAGTVTLGSNTTLVPDTNATTTDLAPSLDGWTPTYLSYTFRPVPSNTVAFEIDPEGDTNCKIDAIKLERGEAPTRYADYRGQGLVYQRMLPNYFLDDPSTSLIAGACYKDDAPLDGIWELKDDAPAKCLEYSRHCSNDELGCNLFTAVKDNFTVSAKVLAQDNCPAECVGYDNYLQTESVFSSQRYVNIIPENARSCNAQAVGCEEFTNLDKVGDRNPQEYGAEDKEYFTYLRQCVQKDEPRCAEFYTWESSSQTGFQLRVHQFKAEDTGVALDSEDPDSIDHDTSKCNEFIYRLPVNDPNHNPDCLEFFNRQGGVSYREYSKTIMCTDNCHPYRKSAVNVVKRADGSNVTTQAECRSYSQFPAHPDRDTHWDGTQCIFCKNRGEVQLDSSNNFVACIYMAVPDQGIKCGASQYGCEEYSGSSGNNVNILFSNDFEGSLQGWRAPNAPTTNTLDSEALIVGGESMRVAGGDHTIGIQIGNMVQHGKSYYLTFIAKKANAGATEFTAGQTGFFDPGTSDLQPFSEDSGAIDLYPEWKIFEFSIASTSYPNPPYLNGAPNDVELRISASGDFLIDDLKLVEITDRYYLIEDSWNIPESCTKNIYGDALPTVNLGCEAYLDMDNNVYYIWNFTSLCHESAAGCELVIDTHNYSDYHADGWNDNDDNICDAADLEDCVAVEGDSYALIAYNASRACNSQDKGCERFGSPYVYEQDTIYEDIYLINNPDQYNSTMCEIDAVGCDEWNSSEGKSYFKDPGDMTCIYDQKPDTGTAGWGWYKKKVKRCDDGDTAPATYGNGVIDYIEASDSILEPNVCLSAKDCDILTANCDNCPPELGTCIDGECHYNCILDENYYECTPDEYKTLGYGGYGQRIIQPKWDSDGQWVGVCPAKYAGCTEYIDPVSGFNANMLFNPDFADLDGDNIVGDGWKILVDPNCGFANCQSIPVEPNTLYRLSAQGAAGDQIDIVCGDTSTPIGFLEINPSSADRNELLIPPSASPYPPNTVFASNRYSLPLQTSEVESIYIYSVDNTECKISSNAVLKKMEFKKVNINYRLRQDVNKDCNGIVNPDDGCVLFNERRVYDRDLLTDIVFDADNSPGDGTPDTNCANYKLKCDSNVILRVEPDRDCAQWLDCWSWTYDDNGEVVCQDLAMCESLDPNGECNGFVVEPEYFIPSAAQNQVYNPADPGNLDPPDIMNMTGYVKVGHVVADNFEPYRMNDLYPLSQPVQEGQSADLYNANFEINWFDYQDKEMLLGYPINWQVGESIATTTIATSTNPDGSVSSSTVGIYTTLADWESGYFGSICSPVVAQSYGIDPYSDDLYTPEGRCFLRYSAANATTSPQTSHSSPINVSPNTEYVISAVIDTEDLIAVEPDRPVMAVVRIRAFDSLGDEITDPFDAIPENYKENGPDVDVIRASSSRTWTRHLNQFKTGPLVDHIRIQLLAQAKELPDYIDCDIDAGDAYCGGSIYIDDIQIKPALKIREPIGAVLTPDPVYEYAPRECRLYPKDDALACDYYEESGYRILGWPGYCLEHDRYPGNPDACLLWYPLDRIQGEEEIEDMGYRDRYPLYYCVEATDSSINNAATCDISSENIYGCGGGRPLAGGGACNTPTCYLGTSWDDTFASVGACIGGYFDYPIVDVSGPCNKITGGVGCDIYINNMKWDRCDGECWEIEVSQDGQYWESLMADLPDQKDCDNRNEICDQLASEGHCTRTQTNPFSRCAFNSSAPINVGWSLNRKVYYDLASTSFNWIKHIRIRNRGSGVDKDCGKSSWDGPDLGFSGGGSVIGVYTPSDCLELVQVVTGSGQNKYWAGRVFDGSGYKVPGLGYIYGSDYAPFGGIVSNYDINDPATWDGNNDPTDGNQPLKVLLPDTSYAPPYQARAGQPYGCVEPGKCLAYPTSEAGIVFDSPIHNEALGVQKVQRLFAKAYTSYTWNGVGAGAKYENTNVNTWDTTAAYNHNLCVDASGSPGPRPRYDPKTELCEDTDGNQGDCFACPGPFCDWCGVPPRVPNSSIKINGESGTDVVVSSNGSAILTFNSIVDSNQLPIVEYVVDWNDGSVPTSETGLQLQSRPDPDHPHVVAHNYNYWYMKALAAPAQCGMHCADEGVCLPNVNTDWNGPYCTAKPGLRIKDNWGWCTNGNNTNHCNPGNWVDFDYRVIVIPDTRVPVQ